ncbi:MAG: tyrosine recombinase [Actinobacteria bacterium]|nr:tyrosine recombinase [Actinomycetota bacterium]
MSSSPNFSVLVKNFLDYLQNQCHYSSHTIQNYRRDLRDFDAFTNHEMGDLNSLGKRTCQQYLYALETQQYAHRSIHRKIASLRSFWRYLIQGKHVDSNPWQLISLPKKPKRLPKVLSTKVMGRFLDALPEQTPRQIRDKCICELLFASGVRVSELVGLDLADIDLANQQCHVTGKGNKERICLFGPEAAAATQAYIDHARPLWAQAQTQALLINPNGQRLSTRSIQRIIKAAGQQLGLDPDITPHSFRHSFATALLDGGADLKSIQTLLGHESISATELYTHLSMSALKDGYDKAHPRQKSDL